MESLSSLFKDAKHPTMTDISKSLIPWQLFKFDNIHNVKSVNGLFSRKLLHVNSLSLSLDIAILRRLALASFSYMIIFAGLEFTITFLVYNRFNWDR